MLIRIISIYFILCLQSLLLCCHPNQLAFLNERQPLGVVSRYSSEPSVSNKCESEKQDEGKDERAGQIKRRQVQDYLGKGQRQLNQGQALTNTSSFISHKVLLYYICPTATTGINALNYFSYYWKVLFNTLHLKTFPLYCYISKGHNDSFHQSTFVLPLLNIHSLMTFSSWASPTGGGKIWWKS